MATDDETTHESSRMTRRDFIGGTLLGSGSALLAMSCPTQLKAGEVDNPPHQLTSQWTGPGGIGDYRHANGNTHKVVNAAHALRDGYRDNLLGQQPIDDIYDIVIVGGGFAGFSAAHTLMEETKGKGRCLILDNHPIFGGEAKQNEFNVEGHQLYGPQGSNAFALPNTFNRLVGLVPPIWDKLHLPDNFEFEPLTGTNKDINIPTDSYSSMYNSPEQGTTGYFFANAQGKYDIAIDIHRNRFRNSPFTEQEQRDLDGLLRDTATTRDPRRKDPAYLDSITYKHYIENILGLSATATSYLDPAMGAGVGLGADSVSAYIGYKYGYPGFRAVHLGGKLVNRLAKAATFPGGNTGILRYFVKNCIPDAIPGGINLEDVYNSQINTAALDLPNQCVRFRGSSTVVSVQHDGEADQAKQVLVTYTHNNQAYTVRARTVVVATGGWVAKRFLRDMPENFADAYQSFVHAPILNINVALKHWRFMEKIGIAGARWFDGDFGWYANIKQPMRIGKHSQPMDPNKPVVLTMYNAFMRNANKGMSAATQASLGRAELFSLSYRDIELRVRHQLQKLFGDYGFNHNRDIAGIITNRWGHAYGVPQPGFFISKDGHTATSEIIKAGYGRIKVGHTELDGLQYWVHAAQQGERAAREAIALL